MSMRTPTTRPVVVSGSDDATVRVWDLDARGLLYQPLEAHQGKVNAVAVGDLAGRPIAISGGNDRTVWVWDLEAGRPGARRWRATTAGSWRWPSASWAAGRSRSPVASTTRCGCGTWRRADRLAGRWRTTASSTRWRSVNSTTARLPLPAMLQKRCGQSWQRRSPALAGKLR